MIIYELDFQKITADAAFCARELKRTIQDKISEPRYEISRGVVNSTTQNLILNRHIDFGLAEGFTFSLAFCGYIKDFIGENESSKWSRSLKFLNDPLLLIWWLF